MAEPLVFDDVSPRFNLPFLFMAQAQKELSVNEAHALTDALLHCAIQGIADTPPASPEDGQNWLVAAGATGEWLGREDRLACRQGGNWLYVAPRDGLRVLNLSTGHDLRFHGSWMAALPIAEPSGGSTVDGEARTAILEIIGALRTAGVIPEA